LIEANTEVTDPTKLQEREIEIQRRLAVPFACMLLPWIGVPLAVRQSRSVRSRGLLVGLAVILAYYFLITAGVTLVRQHVLPAPLGLWIPDLALAVAGWLAFRRAAGERLRRPRKMKAAH